MKKLFNHIFVDGLNGMALGLFCTFALGTILQQIGSLLSKDIGDMIYSLGGIAIILTGAGIGMGMAAKFQATATVALSASIAGMVGAYAPNIFQSSILTSEGVVKLSGPGDPLGAFIAAFVALEIGNLVSGKTNVDLLLTPSVCIGLGSCTGLMIAPIIDKIMEKMAWLIEWSTDQHKIIMGILVSCLMCLFSLLPVSLLTLTAMLKMKGLVAGAATIGCCCSTIGFAVASFRDNKSAGLFIQGIGTSRLQLPNVFRRPYIVLPSLLSSALLGAISTGIFQFTNTAKGAAMGSTGIVGCISAYHSVAAKNGSSEALIIISLMCFVLPGVCSLGVAEAMRRLKLLKDGDMKIGA